ncbi:MAG: ATP-binding protein [Myxococcota bacterium]
MGLRLKLDRALVCLEGEDDGKGEGDGAEALLGVPLAALLGKPLLEVVPFVERDILSEVLQAVFEGSAGAVVVAELRVGGRARWIELRVQAPESAPDATRPTDVPGEGPTRLELALQDVSARVGEEMRLRGALAEERALAEFAAELARWSDAALDAALAAALERIAGHFGADGARIAHPVVAERAPSGCTESGGDTRASVWACCPIPGVTPPRALELVKAGARGRPAPGRLLLRHAEVLAGLVARRDAFEAAPHSEARFRALADHSRDGVCEVDGDARILYASPSFAALCEAQAGALVERAYLEVVEPEDRRRVAQLIRPGASGRRRGAVVYRLRRSGGGVVAVESTAREYAADDGAVRVVVTTRDVTEREQARVALERQIELEARVAELSRHFIDLDVDDTNAGISSQLAVVAGLAEAQHSWLYSFETGRGAPELFDWWQDPTRAKRPHGPEHAVATYSYSSRVIQSGQIYHVPNVDVLPAEAAAEREDMLARGVCSLLGIPIMSGGRFVGFLGFECYAREIRWSEETIMLLRLVGEMFYSCLRRRRVVEDLRDSESQLLQAQKMEAVGTLAGGIAHDFNNHLAVMLGNARFLRQEIEADADVIAAIEDLERSADHCAKLTRSLLAFSRRSPVEVVPVAVAEVVKGVEGLVKPLLPSRFRLETELGSALGEFAVDQVQIQQVLVNLLVNARDAMPEGGRIRIGAERRHLTAAEAQLEGLDERRDYVVLSVEDTGCGMDAETQRRVFEPFFTTKPVGQGTGLGLAMAYGIVRQSGGAITIESAPGEGAVFRVLLPALDREGWIEPQVGEAPPMARRVGRAVVYEPDPATRALVCEGLEEHGFEVEIAAAPERVAEGVRRAGAAIDLVVAAMPPVAAQPDAFAESLRGGITGPPVLALAPPGVAAGEAADRRIRVLRKPLTRSELRSSLEVWLEVVCED